MVIVLEATNSNELPSLLSSASTKGISANVFPHEVGLELGLIDSVGALDGQNVSVGAPVGLELGLEVSV